MRNAEFGRRLRILRQKRGLNQEQLASILKETQGTSVTQSYISHMERTGKIPNGDVVASLARCLRTSTDYLLGLTDSSLPASLLLAVESPFSRNAARIIDRLPEAKQREVREMLLVIERHSEPGPE